MRVWESTLGTATESLTPGTVIGKTDEGIEVACGTGSLVITKLQLPGKKPITANQFLNGRPDFI